MIVTVEIIHTRITIHVIRTWTIYRIRCTFVDIIFAHTFMNIFILTPITFASAKQRTSRTRRVEIARTRVNAIRAGGVALVRTGVRVGTPLTVAVQRARTTIAVECGAFRTLSKVPLAHTVTFAAVRWLQ